jgi:glycosyltransferase involved in cell wall biosynthesis
MIELPQRVLYATSARLGGSGLDAVAGETVRALEEADRLGRALAFDNRIGVRRFQSLRWHPVRLLSFLPSANYYGAKKHALDRAAACALSKGGFDLFHGWSGESVRTLRVAKERGIPSVLEIPTWHRHKGRSKSRDLTQSERAAAEAPWPVGWKNRLLISRQQTLEEYDLADLILVLSEKAAETFRTAGIDGAKLFPMSRGVDPVRFAPAETPPEKFRAIFVGALIKRKGVHRLIEVWKQLRLRDAELVLVGAVHEEIKPFLQDAAAANIRVIGFTPHVQDQYRSASVHIFPSTCEGSAKATYEAAACGLAQITTRESGDVVEHGVNGLIIPADDSEALAEAIRTMYRDADLRARMGAAGRQRVLERFTWAHFRERLWDAYGTVMRRQRAA